MELSVVKDQVAYILEKDLDARDNDKLLQVSVLKTFYNVEKIDDILKPEVPSLESIRRCRQKLQSEGKYAGSKLIKKAREQQEEKFRQFTMAK
ncbi:hypothetical protein [Clostridium sp. HMP27]|uniref:hypothetical protein n=1 Tax=Clostridium sp. HMP27 TaxID=1487921 RepID=UPI00052BC0F7|nr:hypothetical protein [Clostridium sp. HMP27]KGK88006.1 hypothetical protein DP68_08715 [Clostridium sp. HMP27]